MKKKRKKKSTPIKYLEFGIVYIIISVASAVPLRVMKIVSSVLGNMLFFISSKRRNIAVDNLINKIEKGRFIEKSSIIEPEIIIRESVVRV